MTIENPTTRVSYLTDGVTSVFPVGIQAYQSTDFLVLLTNIASGASLDLTLGSNYTLAPASSDEPPKWQLTTQTGAGVTSPIPAGSVLQVVLDPAATQATQYVQGQQFPSLAIETNVDRLTQLALRLQDQINRSVRAPDGDSAPVMLLPAAPLRASASLMMDANGNIALGIPTTQNVTLSLLAGLLGLTQTPAEAAHSITPTAENFLQGDPMRYGAAGTGLVDDTAAVQAAFTVGGNVIIDDHRTFLVSAILGSATVRVLGAGTIRQSANPGVSMIYYPASNPGLSLDLGNATYDGNQAAQGTNPANFTVDFRSAGTSATPTVFNAANARFVNGCDADIRVFSNQTGGLIRAFIGGNTFLGGSQGDAGGAYVPRAIDVADAVDLTVIGNYFDLGASIAHGRAGLVAYYNQAEGQPTSVSQMVRAVVTGNEFNRMGRDQANGQGCIDLYGYTVDVVVTSNVCRNFACRAINVKGSDPRALIANNQVDTAFPGLTNVTTGIVLNASTTTDVFSDARIQGNIVNGTTYDGIYVNGANVNGTGTIQGVVIKGNTVRGCASGGTGRDIAIQACQDADIIGNSCYGNGASNSIGMVGCSGLIRLIDNRLVSPAARAVLLNAGDNNSAAFLEVDGNIIANPGFNGLGSAYYLSTIGGVVFGSRNRTYGALGTPINLDQSASVTGTIAGSVLTVTATGSGTVAVGQVVTAPGTAASNVSIPGLTVASFGTYTAASGTGTLNLSGSPTAIALAQTFNLTAPFVSGLATPRSILLNNNTLGTITVSQGSHLVDTYNAQASGNLYYINGGYPGMEVTLKSLNGARTVVVKDNGGSSATGNIHIGGDFSLAALTNAIKLILNGSTGFWELASKPN